MKRKLTVAGVLLLLLFLLQYPQEALAASREGMKLWLNTLIPTLLPFLILTGFLIHTDGIEKILSPLKKFWKKALGLSPQGAYAFLLGMLCGYPMGAKLASDLYRYGKISRREAEYLLTFCNNASPAFITTYLAQICLDGKASLKEILLILILSDFMCMLFFRFIVYRNKTIIPDAASVLKKETPHAGSPGAIIDVSIMNGFETITRLGGYILLFSILASCISHYWPFAPIGKYLLLGTTEITTGLYQLAGSGLPFQTQYLCAVTMTAFGGLCIMAQTKSVLAGKLSILPYAAAKCLNAVFTAILVLTFSQII
ncbi:MAG: hypothetical protein Q4D16_06480 [Eubacteriales bacterium]|nr:hypothetical protein [Eubacteriales bacterium]